MSFYFFFCLWKSDSYNNKLKFYRLIRKTKRQDQELLSFYMCSPFCLLHAVYLWQQPSKRKGKVENHCTQLHKKENEIKSWVRFQDTCSDAMTNWHLKRKKWITQDTNVELYIFATSSISTKKQWSQLSIGCISTRHWVQKNY